MEGHMDFLGNYINDEGFEDPNLGWVEDEDYESDN